MYFGVKNTRIHCLSTAQLTLPWLWVAQFAVSTIKLVFINFTINVRSDVNNLLYCVWLNHFPVHGKPFCIYKCTDNESCHMR